MARKKNPAREKAGADFKAALVLEAVAGLKRAYAHGYAGEPISVAGAAAIEAGLKVSVLDKIFDSLVREIEDL